MSFQYKTVAHWPGGTTSEDGHSTIESAEGVRGLLYEHGFGGGGLIFPLSVDVLPIIAEESTVTFGTVPLKKKRPADRCPRCKSKCVKVDSDGLVWACGDCEWTRGTKPIVRVAPKIGRNAGCPCGSGRKFKRCCGGGL